MQKSEMIDITLAPYEDPACGLDWPEQTPKIMHRLEDILSSFESPIDYELHEEYLGRGADWPTIIITVGGIAGVTFFAIPTAHKKVREALEEWKLIGFEIRKLVDYVSKKERVVAQPVELLLLVAMEHLEEVVDSDSATFEAMEKLADIGDYEQLSGAYAFIFRVNNVFWEVAVSGEGQIMHMKKREGDGFQKNIQ
ncbi:hypothetical protein LCGC14_2047850 [marine sediment metagenome]|uniref:Uncharacterized protein n=1 Tax=marine sediment metagenome TaxID=412755 RepID=A0A0F9HLV1_9ZZZZ